MKLEGIRGVLHDTRKDFRAQEPSIKHFKRIVLLISKKCIYYCSFDNRKTEGVFFLFCTNKTFNYQVTPKNIV